MQVSEIISAPLPVSRKSLFGEMAVGDAREVRGSARELRNMRKSAHWVGEQFGWTFRTRTAGDVLTVWRVA